MVWDSRKLFAEGKVNEAQMMQRIALSAPSYAPSITTGWYASTADITAWDTATRWEQPVR